MYETIKEILKNNFIIVGMVGLLILGTIVLEIALVIEKIVNRFKKKSKDSNKEVL